MEPAPARPQDIPGADGDRRSGRRTPPGLGRGDRQPRGRPLETPGADLVADGPARTYVITGGRSGPGPRTRLDLVTLVVTVAEAGTGLMPEHRTILALCRRPLSAAEISAHLCLPFSAAAVLIGDLVTAGLAAERRPVRAAVTDPAVLREVIRGLQRL